MELRTAITHDGQRYVDEPITVLPRLDMQPSVLEQSIAAAFNGGRLPRGMVKQPITVGYERVRLRWMTPDGKGGLKERG